MTNPSTKKSTMQECNEKKSRNIAVMPYIDEYLTESGVMRFSKCGCLMEFLADRGETKLKVNRANFCKNPFCPMCVGRKARKNAMKIAVMMDYIEQEHKKAFILVTFTAPNVKGEDLAVEITRYNEAFKKFCKRDEIAKINQGYIRKLEVTYNRERNDFHPHFHCVFAVNKGYFAGHTYVKQERWLDLWREVMDDWSITQVRVQRVKKNNGKEINEVASYTAKDEDYTVNQEVFDHFYKALHGRQKITFNGLFRSAAKKYEAGELDAYKTLDDTEYVLLLLYHWGGSEYVEKRRQEI